jgi:hypothetical protein
MRDASVPVIPSVGHPGPAVRRRAAVQCGRQTPWHHRSKGMRPPRASCFVDNGCSCATGGGPAHPPAAAQAGVLGDREGTPGRAAREESPDLIDKADLERCVGAPADPLTRDGAVTKLASSIAGLNLQHGDGRQADTENCQRPPRRFAAGAVARGVRESLARRREGPRRHAVGLVHVPQPTAGYGSAPASGDRLPGACWNGSPADSGKLAYAFVKWRWTGLVRARPKKNTSSRCESAPVNGTARRLPRDARQSAVRSHRTRSAGHRLAALCMTSGTGHAH